MTHIKHKSLGKLGYTVHISEFDKDFINEIKKDCTVITTVLPAFRDLQKPKKYLLYYISKDKSNLYLPRYYAIKKFGNPKYVSLSKGIPIDVK